MPVCTFCRKQYEFPRGVTVVQKDGSAKFYCASKCRKNSEMGRNNKKVAWVQKSSVIKDAIAKRKKKA
ncbi:50S ribosomal protein L24 [archaeon]|jgi:ribosomal protein L24E|nr:50S ribosomal protein L24 [archaeon]